MLALHTLPIPNSQNQIPHSYAKCIKCKKTIYEKVNQNKICPKCSKKHFQENYSMNKKNSFSKQLSYFIEKQ